MQGKMESEMMPSSFKNFRGHDIVPRNERIESQLAVVLKDHHLPPGAALREGVGASRRAFRPA